MNEIPLWARLILILVSRDTEVSSRGADSDWLSPEAGDSASGCVAARL